MQSEPSQGEENPTDPLFDACAKRETAAAQARRPLVSPRAASEPYSHFLAAFERWAESCPTANAALYGDRALSYGELEARSHRLCDELIAAGVGPGVAVAVCLEPCIDVLVAIVAIFRAGGVYFPLDPHHPAALVQTMCEEARPHVLLARRGGVRPDLTVTTIFVDAPPQISPVRASTRSRPPEERSLATPAYLFYTSGTTGIPKGVRATHGNLAFYLGSARREYGFASDDVFCSIARYTFSISLFELLLPLYCGASVRLDARNSVLDFARFSALLDRITVLHAGPSLLGSFFRWLREQPSERRFSSLRHASSGGDLVGPHIMEQMKRTFDRAEIYVIYGCTEISCMGTSHRVDPYSEEEKPLVGRAFPHARALLVDPAQELVGEGCEGEIALGGPGVVEGYLNRPELDAQRFVCIDGERFYLTGDLGRQDARGRIEMLGRRDFQVQVRGMRVELVGIEQTVVRRRLAAQCVAVAQQVDRDDLRVVAFVVQPSAPLPAIRAALAEALPDYMVPQRVVALASLPLTSNGKVDRRALQRRPLDGCGEVDEAHAPHGELEQRIAAVFAAGLRVPVASIPRHVDFFDLGGHSLLAVTVLRELEAALGRSLPPGALFDHGTVEQLARHASGERPAEPRPIALNASESATKLFMVAGVHVYRELAQHLRGACTVYGLFTGRELTLLDHAEQTYFVPELARAYIELMRKEQPRGPYLIGGTSFGGIVAYEVAQQLRRSGEDIAFVGLIDAILPEPTLASWFTRLRRLAPLPMHELVPLVYQRMKVKLLRALGRRRAAEFAQYEGDERFRLIEIIRADYQSRSAIRYLRELEPYELPLTLVVAGARLRANPHKAPDCGWQRWAPRLARHVVDAYHMALLEEPKVREVAAIFEARIAEASRSGAIASGAEARVGQRNPGSGPAQNIGFPKV